MRRRPRLLFLAAAVLAVPCWTQAWSDPAHRLVAAVAEERLSPQARALVREIVGSKPLSDHEIATWADDVRDRRTGPWHYVNIPFSADGYVAARDCPSAGCVVSALERAVSALRDADNAADLADSLRWVVHLVGDVHQPMHAGQGRDRGGNDAEVRLGRRKQPLSVHRLWDVEVLAPILERSDPLRAARALSLALRPADAEAWSADLSPVTWANESSRLARAIYAELGTFPAAGDVVLLPASYAVSQRARTEGALSKAGVRLAALLNRVAEAREARRSGR